MREPISADMYQPLNGQAVNSRPPISNSILATAGNTYHFKSKSSNQSYLNKKEHKRSSCSKAQSIFNVYSRFTRLGNTKTAVILVSGRQKRCFVTPPSSCLLLGECPTLVVAQGALTCSRVQLNCKMV